MVFLESELRDAETRYRNEAAPGLTPEQIFDRRWCVLLLERVQGRLAEEYRKAGKGGLFDRLQPYLEWKGSDISYKAIAEEVGVEEGSIRVATHRMRRRFGRLLRDEIAHTVENEAEIDAEIRFLKTAFGT
jgi:RNA polymerase sigma-70 factor (ECF subfamily)